jgi:hypothetical protein
VPSDIASPVDHPANGGDAEVSVAQRPVAGQRGGATIDVETVVARSDGDVALQEAMTVLLRDQEPVAAAASDKIAADDIVRTSDPLWPIEAEADAYRANANDDVSGDQVAASLLDPDAVAPGDAVSGDLVPIAEHPDAVVCDIAYSDSPAASRASIPEQRHY